MVRNGVDSDTRADSGVVVVVTVALESTDPPVCVSADSAIKFIFEVDDEEEDEAGRSSLFVSSFP